MPALSIGDCIGYGWETFKKRPWFLIGAFLLASFVAAVPGIFGPQPEIGPDGQPFLPPVTAFQAVMSLVSVVVSFLAAIGMTTFALRAHDNVATAHIGDLWNPAPFWRFVGAHILSAILIMLGLIAFVIPGIMIAMGLSFVPFLVVERGLGPIQAMQESWRITNGHKGRLFLLVLALVGLNFLGLLAFVVGVLVAIPVTMIAFAHAYRTLAT